ncbi:MAG: HAD-IIA family hydrolase [Campylobacterales bacterium]
MWLVDVQGTLIDDLHRQPLPGAIDFILDLKKRGEPFLLITNNTKYPPQEFLRYLQEIGFAIEAHEYLDALMNLQAHLPEKRIFAIGNEGFLHTLEKMGYELTNDKPEAVVVGIKEKLTYDDLADATEHLLAGARLVGMHETSLYAKHGRRYPGLGAILRALEYATGQKAVIVGKPSPSFYQLALERLGAEPREVTIISDDPKGDLVGAKKLGMRTFFVLSGKYQRTDEIIPLLSPSDRPDEIYQSVAQIKGEG